MNVSRQAVPAGKRVEEVPKSAGGVAVDGVIDKADHAGAADEVTERDRDEIAEHVGNADVGVQEGSEREEIHVCDAVLEACGDEGGDGEDDREDIAGDGAPGHREPNGETDEHVAEHAPEERLAE